MHYFKRNIGDYHKKAGRLNMLQHGAYTLLIDACYDRERFPTRDEAIDWCWAVSNDEISAVEFVLSKFFDLVDGTYRQNRIAEEIEQYHATALVNARIAQEREAKKRADKARSVNGASTVGHESPPNHKPLTINHKPLTNTKDLVSPEAQQSKNGSRLPVDWILPDDWMGDAKEIGLSIFDALNESIIFRDYWIGVAGAKGRKADWRATWRNWVRRKAQDRNNQPKPTQSHQDNFIDKHTDASWADGVSSDWRGNPL